MILQIIGIVVVTLLVIYLIYQLILDFKVKAQDGNTNIDSLIGKRGIVLDAVSKYGNGHVKVNGREWVAISDHTIEAETIIIVIGIEGNKLKIRETEIE